MSNKKKPISKVDEALLEMAQDGLFSPQLNQKITLRILGKQSFPAATLTELSPEDIRSVRESANMSQAVFARILNVTAGYVAQLERGAKRPTGPTLALLSVIKRKGIQAIL